MNVNPSTQRRLSGIINVDFSPTYLFFIIFSAKTELLHSYLSVCLAQYTATQNFHTQQDLYSYG